MLNINTKVKLNNGVKIPIIGLGTYQTNPGKETENAVLYALENGYRLIDTAAYYKNEEYIGDAIRKSEIPREEIFVTTKIWNDDHSDPEKAFNRSLEKLNLDYVDLYLIHWPVEERNKTWKIFEKLLEEGKCRTIGVSNFTIKHLNELIKISKKIPVINQIEFSPYLYQKDLLDFCNSKNIQLESYSPLTKGRRLNDKRLIEIAQRYNKTTAQILIRWCLQHNVVVIPKSSNEERIKENIDVFDFNISLKDMKLLDSFDDSYRTSWNPNEVE